MVAGKGTDSGWSEQWSECLKWLGTTVPEGACKIGVGFAILLPLSHWFLFLSPYTLGCWVLSHTHMCTLTNTHTQAWELTETVSGT